MGPGTPSDTLDVYLPAQYNDGFFFNGYETLFSGSVGHPTFIPASFDFPYAGFSNGFGYTLANAHVTATAAVPEPPPLALADTATLLSASCLLLRQRRKRLAPQNSSTPR
jgi:hypothetical protein